MSKDKIKNSYKKKIELLHKHNKLYFEKSNPEISDGDYDNLKTDILKLEKKYSFLKDKKSSLSITLKVLAISFKIIFAAWIFSTEILAPK